MRCHSSKAFIYFAAQPTPLSCVEGVERAAASESPVAPVAAPERQRLSESGTVDCTATISERVRRGAGVSLQTRASLETAGLLNLGLRDRVIVCPHRFADECRRRPEIGRAH